MKPLELAEHEVMNGTRCGKLRAMTVSTEAWKAEHDPHGAPTLEPVPAAPEGYPAEVVVCPCGARLVRLKAAA